MTKLILFDIDGTLTTDNRAHERAFTLAFAQVYGMAADIDQIDHVGKTDRQIVYEILALHRVPIDEIDQGLEKFFVVITQFFQTQLKKCPIKLQPGVKELLDRLTQAKLVLGLVTGNVEAIAWSKMEYLGIRRYLTVGGFGSEHVDRSQLIKIAQSKARLTGEFSNGPTILIGDTPRDISAGQTAGVYTVGVTSGKFNIKALSAEQPDLVIESLSDPALYQFIMGK